jgi:hypothetical protein
MGWKLANVYVSFGSNNAADRISAPFFKQQ